MDGHHQESTNKRASRMLVGISTSKYERDKKKLHEDVRKFRSRFLTAVQKEWCSLYDFMTAGETSDFQCNIFYVFLFPTALASKQTQFGHHQNEEKNTIYLETPDVDLLEKWLEWASGVQTVKFDYVGFSELELLDEEGIRWVKREILKSNQESTVVVTKLRDQGYCNSHYCKEFDFLCLSMDLVHTLKMQSFTRPLKDSNLSRSARLFRSILDSRKQLGSTKEIRIRGMSKESEMVLSTLFKILTVGDAPLVPSVDLSSKASGKAPVTAIFMNGYLHDPSYLWAFSFPRLLLKHMSIHSSDASRLRILGHEARTEKLWRVLPSSLDGEADEQGSDLVEVLDGGKQIQNEMDIIFARNIGMAGLIRYYPDLFEFCEYHRPRRKHRNRKAQETNHTTCPVVVSFPIGTKPCDHCSPEWHLEISDDMHVKTLSSSNWETIALIQKHLPSTGSIPSQMPEELVSLFDHSRWKFITSKGCTIAYVSRWNERKGQSRMTQEFLDYAKAGLMTDMPSTTICFAGSAEGYTKQKEKILRQLNTEFDTIKAVDLGFLSFAEQILLFRLAGKSMLWTDFDQSPRIASLSLASGARVLTTEVAQVPDAIIDDDCLVTILHLFDSQTNPIKERASAVKDFLSKEDRCVKANETVAKAYPILQEDAFYGPIIEKAMSLWTQLNVNRERHCYELFSHECELFGMLRKVKSEWNCTGS